MFGQDQENEDIQVTECRLRRSSGKDMLHGQLRSVRGSNKPLVVFSHGFSVDGLESHRMFHEFARMLNAVGYSTLLFDYLGSGYSDGDYVDFRVTDAANDLWVVAKQALLSTDNCGAFVVVAQSLGTAIAALAEQRMRSFCIGHVLWNVSADIRRRYTELFGDGIAESDDYHLPQKGIRVGKSFLDDADSAPILESLHGYATPLLILICGNDEKSDTSIAEQVIDNVDPSLVTSLRIPEANHSFKGQPKLQKLAMTHSISWLESLPARLD